MSTNNNTLPQVGQSTAAVHAMLRQNRVDATTGGSGLQYLSFDSKRTGEWTYGVEREPCSGERFSLDLTSLKHGWVQWHQRKPNRRLVPINEDKPFPQEPIEWRDPKGRTQVDEASEARSFQGVFEDGTRFEFETCSYGGRKAVDALLDDLFRRAAAGSPYIYPQITLDSDSYEHGTYGLLYNPVLTIAAWYDEEGNEEGAPAAALPEPEPEPEPEAPVRRRRRVA